MKGKFFAPSIALLLFALLAPNFASAGTCGDGVCDILDGESLQTCPVDCHAFFPTAQNVLCVHSQTEISRQICEYYLQKRPGAHTLELTIPDDAYYAPLDFRQTYWLKEVMDDVNFGQFVAQPVRQFVNSHPEWKITHIAVAKDVPIKVVVDDGGHARSVVSAGNFLQFEAGSAARQTDITAAIFGADRQCIENRFHLNPDECITNGTGTKIRFAVSYLSGYNIEDIRKMIDKAQESAPNLAGAKWVMDSDHDVWWDEEGTRMGIMSYGIGTGSIIADRTDAVPLTINDPVVALAAKGGWHANSGMWWIEKWPTVTLSAANRAIIDVYESTFASTFNEQEKIYVTQGKIAEALMPHAFGGDNYSGSFSGGVGTVWEPFLVGVVRTKDIFPAYSSGKTLAESLLFSSFGRPMVMAVGDPIMTIGAPTGLKPNFFACGSDGDCQSGNCDADIAGTLRCHQAAGSCTRMETSSAGEILGREIPSGVGECYSSNNNDFTAACTAGQWQLSQCAGNCGIGPVGNPYCGVAFGGECSVDSDCAHGICSADLTGAKRCHENAGACVKGELGNEAPDGMGACIGTDRKKVCANSAWSAEIACTLGCNLGYCEEEGHAEYIYEFFPDRDYFMTLPLNPASHEMKEIFTKGPGDGFFDLKIYPWNGGASKWGDLVMPWGFEPINQGTLANGQGFSINATKRLSLALQGLEFAGAVPARIRGEWSLIGIPYCGENYTASELLGEISLIEDRCTLIMHGDSPPDPTTYWTESVQGPSGSLTYVKEDFRISNYEAYFVKCASGVDFTFTPTCNLQPALPSVSITTSKTSIAERADDNATITLIRTGQTTNPLAIILTIGGSATNGQDYLQIQNALTIPAGQAAATFRIVPMPDGTAEPSENIILGIAASPNYAIGTPQSAAILILDANAAPPPVNIPPSVAITSPQNGAGIFEGDTIAIVAAANDPDGIVNKVEFFADGRKFSEDTSSPYEAQFTGTVISAYSITAMATDNRGEIVESSPIAINVQPKITLSGNDFRLLPELNGTTVLDSETGKPLLKVFNVLPNDERLGQFEYSRAGENSPQNFAIIKNLPLSGAESKAVYIERHDAASDAVCINDSEAVENNSQITQNCTNVPCSGSSGIYSCTIEADSMVVSGLKHSGVMETRMPFCGDGVCGANESCSICGQDCGVCGEREGLYPDNPDGPITPESGDFNRIIATPRQDAELPVGWIIAGSGAFIVIALLVLILSRRKEEIISN